MEFLNADKFNALIETHLEAPGRSALNLVSNTTDSEDIVQKTFMRVIERLVDLRDKAAQPWFLTEMHYQFVDGARRAERSPVTSVAALR